ncbi:hypothetical protein GLE_0219 [Lysobacter enzymogenes]|uniref:Uncharacterized protein n=1 Tax=Lysobacter enzymogenes TaxID=69 RepID=A0A0S2DAM5_LYSEN|nr:hypothetical protein GLE_0219 [Lysobacter enzymogenes]
MRWAAIPENGRGRPPRGTRSPVAAASPRPARLRCSIAVPAARPRRAGPCRHGRPKAEPGMRCFDDGRP